MSLGNVMYAVGVWKLLLLNWLTVLACDFAYLVHELPVVFNLHVLSPLD